MHQGDIVHTELHHGPQPTFFFFWCYVILQSMKSKFDDYKQYCLRWTVGKRFDLANDWLNDVRILQHKTLQLSWAAMTNFIRKYTSLFPNLLSKAKCICNSRTQCRRAHTTKALRTWPAYFDYRAKQTARGQTGSTQHSLMMLMLLPSSRARSVQVREPSVAV